MPKMIEFKELQPLIKKCYEFQNKGYGTVFIHISGHVGTIDISLHTHGWVASSDADFENSLNIEADSRFKSDIQKAIQRVTVFMRNLETKEKKDARIKKWIEDSERKRYEALKKKFGDEKI